jgi:hypothetical protein
MTSRPRASVEDAHTARDASAGRHGRLEQQRIQSVARDGDRGPQRGIVRHLVETRLERRSGRRDDAPALEARGRRGRHGLEQAELAQQQGGGRAQAFAARLGAGERVAVDEQHVEAPVRETQRADGARGAGADDHDIGVLSSPRPACRRRVHGRRGGRWPCILAAGIRKAP